VVLVLREAVSSYNLKVRATGGALALLVKGGARVCEPPFCYKYYKQQRLTWLKVHLKTYHTVRG